MELRKELRFFDYTEADSGRTPDYILKDEKLVALIRGGG